MAFTLENWNLFDECQAWCDATTGTIAERKAKLADPVAARGVQSQPLPLVITSEFDQIFVVQIERDDLKEYEGLTLRESAERTGKHPVDAMLDLAVADDLRTEFDVPGPNQNMDYMKEMLDYPYLIPGVSDGGAHTKFFTGGQYPTEFLSWLVRDHTMLSLEDAHWRLSALPAFCAVFSDRGLLREGAPADVVVYDFDRLRWADGNRARLSRRRMAARAQGRRLPLHHGQRRNHDARRRTDGRVGGKSAAPRQRWVRRGAHRSMVKAFNFFKRKPGLSVDDFRKYWLNEHAAIIRAIPELRKVRRRRSRCRPPIARIASRCTTEFPKRGSTTKTTIRSDRRLAAATRRDPPTTRSSSICPQAGSIIVDEIVQKEGKRRRRTRSRCLSLLTRKPGTDVASFQTYWRTHHGPLAAKIPQVRRYVQCHVRPSGIC